MKKQTILNESSYNSGFCYSYVDARVAGRYASSLMKHGKKKRAFRALLSSIDVCKARIFQIEKEFMAKKRANTICSQVLDSAEPIVEVRKVRVRANTHQVPYISHVKRRQRLALDFVLGIVSKKKQSKERVFSKHLGQELFETFKKHGESVVKKNQIYKTAAQNRAYTRYKWW